MLSDLQRKKLDHLFDLLDFDGNGRLERVDFEAIGAAIAAGRGLAKGAPATASLVDAHVAFWGALAAAADTNRDGSVSREEWHAFLAAVIEAPGLYEQAMAPLSALVVRSLDADGDGHVTNDEYRAFLAAYRVPEPAREEALRHVDPARAGQVSVADSLRLTEEFFRATDPAAAGNWLFGPL